jgi:hypothetical protein
LEGNTPEKGDGRDREVDREMNPVQGANPASKEITPDKPEDESFNDMNAPQVYCGGRGWSRIYC